MSTALRLTYDDYVRMIDQGAFDALHDRRLELIHGELREMTPPGIKHVDAVRLLNGWSHRVRSDDVAYVFVQDPFGIPELDTSPQPDITWLKPKKYSGWPNPRDVLLLIEVADSSLAYDTGLKAEIYAQAGIKDYWVVNIPDQQIEVFRQPKRSRYLEHRAYQIGEKVSPLAFPKLSLAVATIFGAG